ncbi:MAG: magnesium/cobalt transporter CorA [Myxococcota bacterium]
MIRTHILHDDGRVEGNAPIAHAFAPPAAATVWVDMLCPTEEEIALLAQPFGFHPLAVEDVRHAQKRSKYERYPNHAFVVTQALDRTTDEDLLDTVPISIFLRSRLVVSVRPKEVAAVESVFAVLASFPERIGPQADHILHAILDAVIDEYTNMLYTFEARVEALQEPATQPDQIGLVEDLVWVRRDLLMLRRLTLPQIELVRRFVDADPDDLGGGARIYFRDVLDHLTIILEHTALLLDVSNGALQVHQNAVNERLNQVMKYLAIVSTLALPWTVVSGIFGMNFDVIPISHQVYGFWVAVGLMFGSALLLLAIFRARRWF